MTITTARITPLEVLTLLHEFGESWRSGVSIDLSTEIDVKGNLFFQVGVQASVQVNEHEEPRVYRSSSRWPNTSHQSLLAMWVWLAHNVDQQVDAAMALQRV